ncbi:MaoC family dehydratase N-terminal domain-containing protein [Paraburkholderia sp. C35]|uniref:FAS1-like dehydratase domain-containing protein n=1 Tax=Paraburkholderia sp. C35 TaxID=2126993 RepID=UPI000D695020|nr:MaoC family dehydratase N-terminal domain-containing protein [Paraburkholderia sp. C35]
MSNEYITDKVKSIIGAQTGWVESTHPVEAGEVRRFHHATMDGARRYWDEDWAATSRYGSVVAPPGFPVHAFRREANSPDPLDDMNKPDYDGLSRSFSGLPAVEVELPRDLNGGYEYELYRYARVGEKVMRQARYKDIVQRDGKSGPMVFVIIEEIYTTEAGEKLLKVTNTQIMR